MSHASVALALAMSLASSEAAGSEAPARLDLAKLFISAKEGTRVAPAVEALRGRRVRVVGYMARMEEAPRGAFYLTRTAVEADESGAGTADLPPHAVRVEVPRLAGEEIAWVPGPVTAIGTLEVGRAEDPEGRVSWLRVVLDAEPIPAAPPSSQSSPLRHRCGVTRSECQEEHP